MSRQLKRARADSKAFSVVLPNLKVDSTNRMVVDAAVGEHAAMAEMLSLVYKHPKRARHMLAQFAQACGVR